LKKPLHGHKGTQRKTSGCRDFGWHLEGETTAALVYRQSLFHVFSAFLVVISIAVFGFNFPVFGFIGGFRDGHGEIILKGKWPAADKKP
jgi:hypothetical protein